MHIPDLAEYALFRGLTTSLGILPGSVSLAGLRAAGRLVRRRGWFRAELARVQVAAAFPDWEPERIDATVKGMFDHLALMAEEVWGRDRKEVLTRCRVPRGWDPLEEGLASGRGLILASAHLGNFEWCGRLIASRHRLLDVVKPQRNRWFDRDLDRMRRAAGIDTVPVDGAGPAVMRRLKQGGVVSLLLDQDAGAAGVRTRFFGRPASTWPGAARLSLQLDCPVLPVCLIRLPDRGHELVWGAPLDPRDLPATAAHPAAYTQLISDSLEAFIRLHPEQWFWVHRRWKGADEAQVPQEP
ncbi:lysophospholipid acyltransferase family protein [bacterium]|nr:lysophospholipid acyltransferase family protein [bacterium]